MTTKICKKCKHKQRLNDDRINTVTWVCSDCTYRNKLLVATVAVLFTIGSLGAAYAGTTETFDWAEICDKYPYIDECGFRTDGIYYGVKLPLERHPAQVIGYWSEKQVYTYDFYYGLEQWLKDSIPQPPPVGDETATYELWISENLGLIEANDPQPPGFGSESDGFEEQKTVPEPDPLADLDPEVRKALSTLKICQLGIDEWKAIVPSYNLTTSDEAPIFKHLEKNQQLKQLALDYEECRGQQDYSWLSQQYNHTYTADQEGKKLALENRGLDETRYFPQKDATPENIADAETRASDFMCSLAGKRQGLCSGDLTGKNRGDPNYFSDAAVNLAREYAICQEANVQTDRDIRRNFINIQTLACDSYSSEYDTKKGTDKYPEWLKTACEYKAKGQ